MILSMLLPIALKSLVIAGAVLLLLKLMANRSAADRSLIAHLGLAALLALPIAALALPTLDVAGPEFLAPPIIEPTPVALQAAEDAAASALTGTVTAPALAMPDIVPAAPRDWAFLLYALPAAVLLGLTLLALGRLVLLKHRATVMIEAGWLSALAQAQRRMGFKHGTALLTSDDLPSPISWGVVRPVILLNSDAAGSSAEAEAVIAHELAHVAHFDWAKLLIARLCIALFWFNPLVWLLAREAHQLREEAADDAVLAANIEDTDYAKLLVGVARHECRGLLIGAHGVAPSKNSLARRVRRVLDGALNRAPGGWRWTSAAAFFAAGMAVPLAALTIVPPASGSAQGGAVALAEAPATPAAASAATPATPIAAAAAPAAQAADASSGPVIATPSAPAPIADGRPMMIANRDGTAILRGPNGATMVARADGTASVFANGRAIAIAGPDGTSVAISDRRSRGSAAIDRAVTMKAVGVTPAYARSLAALGYANLSADELVQARALGIDANYIRSLASAGYRRLSIERLVELKALNVTSSDISRYRRAKGSQPDIAEIIELKALGVHPREIDPHPDDRDPGN